MRKPPALPRHRVAAFVGVAAPVALTLGAAACSAAPAPVRTVSVVRAAASPAATIPGCRTGVWAQKFTDAGALAWQLSLPVTASTGDAGSLNGSVSVAQPWLARGAVIALTGVNSKAPALVALNPATGEVQWRTPLGSGPLEPGPLPVTTDGIAVVSTGRRSTTLTGIDLSDGKRVWTHVDQARQTVVQASGPDLVVSTRTSFTSPATLAGLYGRSGAALWKRAGFPGWVGVVPAPGGRVLLDGVNASPAPGAAPPPVTALSAATGRTLWQVKTKAPVTALWPTTAGVAIATGLPGQVLVPDPAARLYLASLATGKVRWSAPGHTDPEAVPAITSGEVVTVITTPSTGTVTARSAQTGAVLWKAPITDTSGRYLARPAGPNLLVAFPGAWASKPSRLLVLDAAIGATRATELLPATATVGTPLTVAGGAALAEPLTVSCAAGVHP